MKFISILVEGQTEYEFVTDILNEYLLTKDIHLRAIIAKTKQPARNNPAYRGGIVSFGKIEFDLRNYLRDSSVAMVTTMIDYYRLPTDFPGYNDPEAQSGATIDRVHHLEAQFAKRMNHPKFFPYFSVHEFEALLFTEPEKIVLEVAGEDEKITANLNAIRHAYPTPEDINLQNPPSKRIIAELKSYKKVAHGYGIAIDIGIEAMRNTCPHFNSWLTQIENV